jgi:hypothetical protein
MQQEVSAVCEGYRAKTNPWIVIVSTPYKPGDIFESIDSIFHKLSFHYSVGLDKNIIQQILKKKRINHTLDVNSV